MKREHRSKSALRVWGLGALLCLAAACNSVIGADEPELVDDLGSGGVGGGGADASAGSGGNTFGGTAGTAGKGGTGGSAGSGGAAGAGGIAGAAGSAGSAGTGGAAGTGGVGGAAGTGGAPECSAAEKDCDGLTPRECSNGQWAPSGPACDYACKDGACYGECADGATECVSKKFRTCGTDYTWQETDCPLVCDSTLGCVGSCLPDTYQCNGATVLEKCSAQGQFQTDQVCTHECAVVGGTAKCVDCTNGDSLCPSGCTYSNDTDCPKGNGETCGGNGECGSGFCVDGVCCNTSCTGSCMQCNLGGKVGTCSSISFTNDVDNCGSCGAACSGNHITRSCVGGQCVGGCDTGYLDCDTNKRTNGCEVNIQADADNCGSCNASCSGNHISRVCSSGECVGTCSSGYLDCNSNKRTDGCEVNKNTDPNHCNTCSQVCQYGVCQSATCAFTKYGRTGVPSADTQLGANYLYLSHIQIGGSGGNLAALGIVLTVAGGETGHVRLGLYTDSGGAPNILVAQTAPLNKVDGETEGLVSPVSVSAGDYWVAMVADNTFRPGIQSVTEFWQYKAFSYGQLPNTVPAGLMPVSQGRAYVYAVVTP